MAFYLFSFLKGVLDLTGLVYALMNNHDILPNGQFLANCIHAWERDLITLGQTQLAECQFFLVGQKKKIFTISFNFCSLIEATKENEENKIGLLRLSGLIGNGTDPRSE